MPWYPCPECCGAIPSVDCDVCLNAQAPAQVCVEVAGVTANACCSNNLNGKMVLPFDVTTLPACFFFGNDIMDKAAEFGACGAGNVPVTDVCAWRCEDLGVTVPSCTLGNGEIRLILAVDQDDNHHHLRLVINLNTSTTNDTLVWGVDLGEDKPNCLAWSALSLAFIAGESTLDGCVVAAGSTAEVTAAGAQLISIPDADSCCLNQIADCYVASRPLQVSVTLDGFDACPEVFPCIGCVCDDCPAFDGTYVLDIFRDALLNCEYTVAIDICGYTELRVDDGVDRLDIIHGTDPNNNVRVLFANDPDCINAAHSSTFGGGGIGCALVTDGGGFMCDGNLNGAAREVTVTIDGVDYAC